MLVFTVSVCRILFACLEPLSVCRVLSFIRISSPAFSFFISFLKKNENKLNVKKVYFCILALICFQHDGLMCIVFLSGLDEKSLENYSCLEKFIRDSSWLQDFLKHDVIDELLSVAILFWVEVNVERCKGFWHSALYWLCKETRMVLIKKEVVYPGHSNESPISLMTAICSRRQNIESWALHWSHTSRLVMFCLDMYLEEHKSTDLILIFACGLLSNTQLLIPCFAYL